ncbi:hypothetical protein ACLKMH_21785 [Psychromonas sp. KJ10-10]|uniref:hypothetical protein n=1 Tax=Psychromonas sp. KJ10-10 TaxID=3391823 RepID=UPI0039B5EEB3
MSDNLDIELLRTLIAIADTGSYGKASVNSASIAICDKYADEAFGRDCKTTII